jgi:hypothetical protein
MRNQWSQKNKNQVFDYTNDSFIRKESHLDYTPQSNKKTIDKVLQENFFLKKLSSKIIFLLTIQLQENKLNETQIEEHAEEIKKITGEWKKGIQNGELFEKSEEIDQNQIMEVIEWLSSRSLTMREKIQELEGKLRKSEKEKEKYLKSLESVKINGNFQIQDDFDADFYQRKLDQVKESIGRLKRDIGK